MKKYQVYVGNIGLVAETNNLVIARQAFRDFVAASKGNYGRASGETVFIMEDGEPMNKYDYQPVETEPYTKAKPIPNAQELLNACESALDLIKSNWPQEHGNKEVGKTWGQLEDAINKAKGRAVNK